MWNSKILWFEFTPHSHHPTFDFLVVYSACEILLFGIHFHSIKWLISATFISCTTCKEMLCSSRSSRGFRVANPRHNLNRCLVESSEGSQRSRHIVPFTLPTGEPNHLQPWILSRTSSDKSDNFFFSQLYPHPQVEVQIISIDSIDREYKIKNLEPGAGYYVMIAAKNSAGVGTFTTRQLFGPLEDIPGEMINDPFSS